MPCRLSRGPAGCDGMLVAEHAVGKAKEIAAKDVDPAGCSVFQWAAGRSREASSTTFGRCRAIDGCRSEEHTSELQSLMCISYAVFCLKKKHAIHQQHDPHSILRNRY